MARLTEVITCAVSDGSRLHGDAYAWPCLAGSQTGRQLVRQPRSLLRIPRSHALVVVKQLACTFDDTSCSSNVQVQHVETHAARILSRDRANESR